MRVIFRYPRNLLAIIVLATGPLSWSSLDEGLLHESFLQTSSQEQFSKELESQAVSVGNWLESLTADHVNFLCLGESHTKEHRQLLAEQVFRNLPLDHLLLEASQHQVEELVALDQQGVEVSLLGAPLSDLLRVVRSTSPSALIWGVEMSSEQKAFSNLNPQKALARDGWIASNILKNYQVGGKTVALYGASHCAKSNVDSGWMRPFYSMLREALPVSEKMLSAKVIVAGGHVKYPLPTEQTLLLYLKETHLDGTSFVLPRLKDISKNSYNSKVEFLSLFESYDALIFLRWP